ncbi:hypothetical protein D3C78_1778110 [compost metagenome]
MRGHGNTRGIFHYARFHGVDRPFTDIGRGGAAKAVEGLFQVETVVVEAVVIGLPELQKRIANQVAVTVINVTHQ